jgi:two-component system, NtrC family, sensor kinase
MNPSLGVARFYEIFRDITRLVHASTDVHEVLELVVWKVTEAFQAKGALLRILDLREQQLTLRVAHGLSDRYLAKGPVLNNDFIVELCRQNRVIVIDDILNDPRLQYPQEAWEEGIRTMLVSPLTMRQDTLGILRIVFSKKRTFSRKELDFLITIAQQCACAIEKARLFEEQQSRYDQLALQTEKLSALGRMAAGIAHEINNPLSGILLYSTNMRKKTPHESPFSEGLDIIIQETLRCRTIIQDLLEFSRDREPRKVRVNVTEIIEKALVLLENEFRLHHITLNKDLLPDVPESMLDANQMQQVFINLLLNAEEAVQEGGTVTVRTSMDTEKKIIRVEIADTGCGIPPENLPQIFEPFFSTKPKGTGLGLAVSYGIIRNHQGDVEVSSEPGKGSCFVIQLPIF